MDNSVINREQLIHRVKNCLQRAYGDRLKGVVLYGSEAREEADPDSDIDILVLLKGPISLWKDIRTNVEALYDLQLEILRPLHAMPVNTEDFEAGKYAVYRNAKREGIFVRMKKQLDFGIEP